MEALGSLLLARGSQHVLPFVEFTVYRAPDIFVIWEMKATITEGKRLRFFNGISHKQRHIAYHINVLTLTHWGRATHICLGKITTIGSDNGLSPGRRQTIIWANAGILLIGPFGTNFSEILIEIQTFSFKKMHLKMSSAKWRPFVSASMN